MKFFDRLIASILLITVCLPLATEAQPTGPPGFEKIYSQRLDESHNAFDFWLGNWEVTWQRWIGKDSYQATNISQHRVFAALDGKALIELAYEDSIVLDSKTAGFSIRYFDDKLQKWVMFQCWPGKNRVSFSSLQGTHHHKRIQLYRQGKLRRPLFGVPAGTTYDNRYTFSDAHPDSFRWESSVSLDMMRTWATLNIAEGNRLTDFDALVDDQKQWFTQGDSYDCGDSLLAPLAPYLGTWTGELTYIEGKKKTKYKTERVLKPFLSGCAALGYQINYIGGEIRKEIIFVSPLTDSDQWVFYTLNNQMGESHKTFFADNMGKETLFTKKDTLGVTSSGSLNSFSWKASKPNKQIIKGDIPEKDWAFQLQLVRQEED
ncbi:MAG: hypothetical protein ABJF11_02925 [Reichenbachiella sp.]|uniref:hypothetical protein n=1 Tax=Reichenbachiella sp. TaxID=2184521 RepID=UPI0032641376